MEWSPYFNLIVGVVCLFVAFAPTFRPMSWGRFYLNVGFGAVNLAIAIGALVAG